MTQPYDYGSGYPAGQNAYPQGQYPGKYPQGQFAGPYPAPYNPHAKSKIAAALLAFFLGNIGAHSFYRGQLGRGFAHLVLAIVPIALIIVAVTLGVTAAEYSYDSAGGVGVSPPQYATWYVGATMSAYVMLVVNGIWTFIEFIMILASNDGSLQ